MSSDMEGITGSILLLCLIGLTNANTSPTIHVLVYNVCEDTPIGADAFTIVASDAENDPLTFSLTGPNALYFTVDNTGTVKVRRHLDRESSDLMQLGVSVSDGFNTRNRELNIILLETNDNKPIFQESSYDVEIPENTLVGTSLFKVHAIDADTSIAGVVQYSIDEVTPNDGFSLFSIVSTTGEVKLNGHLNYTSLSTFYRLKINATDGGGHCYFKETVYFSSIAFSFITVVDVPDLNPRFINLPYIGKVEENSPKGMSVFKVTAIDQDTGVNDYILYSIEDSTPHGMFTISRDDGVISVLTDIDREIIGDTVTLTIKAIESKPNIQGLQASTMAKVQINIVDINDNKPEFYKCAGSGEELLCVKASNFTGEVFEHSLGSIPIDMTVKDLDKFSNTELILEGADSDVFSVVPRFTSSDSIVQLLVKQPEKLNFEKIQQIVVQVVAIDQEKTSFRSTATVTINIKDTNDNSPKFPQDTYKLQVAEHSPVGTVLAKIAAEDPDTMDQGKITYRLLPDSILQYFDVEPHTGTVFVKNESLLDREVRSLYSATLQAKDTDGKPGTTVLEITVTDINDQHPVINRDSYLVFVEEGGQLYVKIEATDADDPNTVNSQIVYGIMPSRYSNNFTIDPNTGVLRNRGELDREALDPKLGGRIQLNVTATDKGTPPLDTVVTVTINVEDVNDNSPKFEPSSYNFYVKEGEKGAFVGSVYAEDLDQTTDFNRISFSIIDGSFGSFIIRTFAEEWGYRGNIAIDPDIELDYESTRKQYILKVEATDLEQKKAVVMVPVDVLDVNDERPEFNLTETVTVKENTASSEAVGSFTAQDKDGNHSLVYQLESMKCRCNSSLTPCSWFILDPTGEVRPNPEYKVDYEQCDQVVIEAQVVDENTEKGHNNSAKTGKMVIYIEDINDNAPEFLPSHSVFVVVSESASKGTSVAGVTAIDRDSDINREIDFKVTAVQFEDTNNHTTNMRMLFEAVTTQQKDIFVGIIQTTEGLELSLKGKYLVTVTATDTGGLSSSTVLEIFTVDESYKVELQFTRTVDDVEQNRNKILRSLMAATKAAVEVVAIRPDSAEKSRALDITVMVAYFVYSNGTALTSNEVEIMLSDPEHYSVLTDLGLRNIGMVPVFEADVDPVKYILLGMVGGLIIVLAVLTTSLLCTRRKYRRKLKAAKAMNSASMVISDNQKSGPVVPGTNKYTMEGANPVLNLNFNTTMDLDLDEESSDVDKVSLNSLDYGDEMTIPENDTKPSMMIKEEEEEEDSRPPEYIEPLGAALAQRGQKKDKPRVGFNNPAFSTTDL
ncbi:cadherin-related family member 2 isoform X2 [Xiphias gladius]|uniref:cadherin-related family member 2 isoform X2 n=1 Tax=Xiphias gladius TaxID=8245 RepID=UPI001A995507|nr:cadherin-related family member 2 isoform X2 [Xiphias gladius]